MVTSLIMFDWQLLIIKITLYCKIGTMVLPDLRLIQRLKFIIVLIK